MGFYCAYGSNMTVQEITAKCTDAKLVGTGYIKDRRLEFYEKATIVHESGGRVPVVIWSLSPFEEAILDRYEDVPILYNKDTVMVRLSHGVMQKCMVYVLNLKDRLGLHPPAGLYYDRIKQGFLANGLPLQPLEAALARSLDRFKKWGNE